MDESKFLQNNPRLGIHPQDTYPMLGGGFEYLLFSPLPGEMIQIDWYFSKGLKPPTRMELREKKNTGRRAVGSNFHPRGELSKFLEFVFCLGDFC